MDGKGNQQTSEALPPEALYRRCDIERFRFKTTAELEDLAEFAGQDRALEAVQFEVGIQRQGFTLFLLGLAGTGKYAIVSDFLARKAAAEPMPDDWCYVNDFDSPETPHVLRVPAGRGPLLREDIRRLLENLKSAIPSAFESENYRARKHVIEQEVKERQEKALEELQREANQKGIAVLEGMSVEVRYLYFDPGKKDSLLIALKAERNGVLVLGSRKPLEKLLPPTSFLSETEMPLLILGSKSGPQNE